MMLSHPFSWTLVLLVAYLSVQHVQLAEGDSSAADLYKRFRSDLGKREWEDSDEKRASFRTDLGKRRFRGDLGKRFALPEGDADDYEWVVHGNNRVSVGLMNAIKRHGRLGFRADLGKRAYEDIRGVDNHRKALLNGKDVDELTSDVNNDFFTSKKSSFRSDLGKRSVGLNDDRYWNDN